jgi:hypothetical protein
MTPADIEAQVLVQTQVAILARGCSRIKLGDLDLWVEQILEVRVDLVELDDVLTVAVRLT